MAQVWASPAEILLFAYAKEEAFDPPLPEPLDPLSSYWKVMSLPIDELRVMYAPSALGVRVQLSPSVKVVLLEPPLLLP